MNVIWRRTIETPAKPGEWFQRNTHSLAYYLNWRSWLVGFRVDSKPVHELRHEKDFCKDLILHVLCLKLIFCRSRWNYIKPFKAAPCRMPSTTN